MNEQETLYYLQEMDAMIRSIARIYSRRCCALSYEDMVSDLKLAVIEALSRPEFALVREPRSYLKQVVKRTAWKLAQAHRQKRFHEVSSQDLVLYDEEGVEGEPLLRNDSPSPEDVEWLVINRMLIEELLGTLSPRHASMIRDLFFAGYSLDSDYIVNTYGNGSRSTVQRMYRYILGKLRKVAEAHGYFSE